jgi:uncharacterized protein YfaS (alpha-2-macroglobulin family)
MSDEFAPVSGHISVGQETIKQFKSKKKKIYTFLSIFFIILALFLGFYFLYPGFHQPKLPSYTQTYRLVPEKISQSASIKITLPPGIDEAYARENIKFFPEMQGQWLSVQKSDFWSWLKNSNTAVAADLAEEEINTIFYRPEEPLSLNRYYNVELATIDGGLIKEDFLAVENPEILAVFPKENSEAPENSEITIIFNRPMVPLTTLSKIEEEDVPVIIEPKTEGRYKWITTRNLQFIPKERLQRSSNYTVKIKSGFISMDGLKLDSFQNHFYTRKLRYKNIDKGKLIYNQPFTIYFNQPVDLDKTEKEIVLVDRSTGKKVPFVAEYRDKIESEIGQEQNSLLGVFDFGGLFSETLGFASIFGDRDSKKGDDQSVIQIYNKKDRFGRKKLWDFLGNYTLTINKAYPTEGDIILDESREINIYITDVIKNITAESEKTNYATPDFFDPKGKLWVDFYEDINLEKSKFEIPKLQDMGYGEKCKEEDGVFSSNVECEKVPDKKKVYIIFKSQELGLEEQIEINFKKIINIDGLQINKEPIKRYVNAYPKFKILKTFPDNGSNNADLREFVICSNSPLLVPESEDYRDHISMDLDYEINYWSNSRKIERIYQGVKCNYGEFQTSIGYGLMPISDYNANIRLNDVFSQRDEKSLSFATGPMQEAYLNFYQFQSSYVISSPVKTKLTYAATNMDFVDVNICKLDAKDFLYYVENKPRYYAPVSSVGHCKEIVRDRIVLPKRYWIKNYFYFDIKDYLNEPLGHYIITFSNPNYKNSVWQEGQYVQKQTYERTYLSITNLAVSEKRIDPGTHGYGTSIPLNQSELNKLNNFYWVTDISTLEPKVGAKVALYGGANLVLAGNYYTDAEGVARTAAIYDLKGSVVSKGNDSTIIPLRESRIEWANSAYLSRKIYLYTDKPIYQPLQTVFIKGIYRTGFDGNYQVPQDKLMNLKVYNPKNDEILSENLTISDFGTFDTKIILEKNSPLGMYRICTDKYVCSYFDVQEYVPAPFEVEIFSDKEEYISKDTIKMNIGANYYFGVPLEGGKVSYTLSSQNYYFDRYQGGYFNFGSRWSYWMPYSYGDKFILRGEESLSTDGKAEISQAIDFEKLFKDQNDRKSKIFVLDINVTNLQGQTISSQKSFIVHAGEFYLGLTSDKSFVSKNQRFNMQVKAVDLQGEDKQAKNLSLSIYKVKWNRAKRQGVDGGYSYKWERERKLLDEYRFNTDKSGNYSKELSIPDDGEYEIEVRGSDKKGNLIQSTHFVYVYGEGSTMLRPTKETELELEAIKTDLNVGDIATVIIKSPYPRAKAFISIERGKVFDYEIKEIKGNFFEYSFPIKEEYLPNVYFSVLLQSIESEVRFGNIRFNIDTERRNLDVIVSPNKRYYLPGEGVVLDIKAKDHNNKGVSAELSVAVVDLSVLALKGNPKKNPLVFFYGGFPLTVSTGSNIKNILVETKILTKGGGGGPMASESADQQLARQARGEFKETAFWQAVVRTDSNGNAQVKFTLPDNLTTWRTETLGITKDNKFGVDYQEFVSKKELMIVPLKPRFIIPGDKFNIGTKVFNQSNNNQNITVKIESQTLLLSKIISKNITLKPDKTRTVYFEVQAPENIEKGEHQFILSAVSNSLEDKVIQYIPITQNDTYEVTATANYTNQDVAQEYVFLPNNIVKDKGGLSVKSSATLAVFLSDALNHLLGSMYGCTDQVASKLNAIAIVKKGLALPNIGDKLHLNDIEYNGKKYSIDEIIEIGLLELYNNQKTDGGFSFWKGGDSNFYITLKVVEAFNNLQIAGINVNRDILNKATSYLNNEITTNSFIYNNKNILISTAYTLSKNQTLALNQALKEKVIDIANDDLFIHDQISSASLAYLSMILTDDIDSQLKNKIFKVLENRIDIDARGSFLEPNKNRLWYFESTIKDTSLYLKALSLDKRDNQIIDKTVRWLLNSRAKDGSWGSNSDTLAVVDAFTEFLKWRRETESNFNLTLSVNNKQESEFRFQPQTVLEQLQKDFSLNQLNFNENNIVEFKKTNHNRLANNFYYDMSLKYYLPIENIAPRDEGFSIIRGLYQLDDKKNEKIINRTRVGEVLRAHIQITVPKTRKFVFIEDFIPAGMEIVNLDLSTEQKSLRLQETEIKGRELISDFKEFKNDRVIFFKENLSPGVYEIDYFVRALVKGEFAHLPAIVSEMYFPENFGRTSAEYFTIQ